MNWMKYTLIYFLISSLIIIPGVYSLLRFGLQLSIEFTGGARYTISSAASVQDEILSNLKDYNPHADSLDNGDLVIKSKDVSQSFVEQILKPLHDSSPSIKLLEFESIGPVLGQETVKKTLNAMILASCLLLAYISFSFKQLKYGVCAILAMFHDTAILLGSFSLAGHFWGVEVDLLFVTAVLTILSFSVHDTIVVYDRIRELSHKHKHANYVHTINQAVTETMSRSLNNSLTIIFMLLSMFLIGGSSTRYFALALLIGTVTGTYSSTFTAAPLLVVWNRIIKK